VNGGVAPYNVTLNNGGGTQSGSGPFIFTVSPTTSTNYQVSSATDAEGCAVTVSGSAAVTVDPYPTVAITPSPASVFANSSGNQASAPAGLAGYDWTIGNGYIIGPNNQPTVNYIAGVSGSVTLGVTAYNPLGCSSNISLSVPIITGLSVHTNLTFTNYIAATTMGITFDGTNYWDCSGGSTGGLRLGNYSASGALLGTYSPGLDFRSIMTTAGGTVLARAFNTNVIYQQTSPGICEVRYHADGWILVFPIVRGA
jgi:hypothetical protein